MAFIKKQYFSNKYFPRLGSLEKYYKVYTMSVCKILWLTNRSTNIIIIIIKNTNNHNGNRAKGEGISYFTKGQKTHLRHKPLSFTLNPFKDT